MRRDANFDGKFLLRTSDESLTAADIATGYKGLYEAERGWRDLKSTIDLRPVYHHREDRIRAHVQLQWLALLLLRVAETTVGDTWRNIRNELDRIHLVTLATTDGQVAQRSSPHPHHHQRAILTALDLGEPPRFFDFTPPSTSPKPRLPRSNTTPQPQRAQTACSTTTSGRSCPHILGTQVPVERQDRRQDRHPPAQRP